MDKRCSRYMTDTRASSSARDLPTKPQLSSPKPCKTFWPRCLQHFAKPSLSTMDQNLLSTQSSTHFTSRPSFVTPTARGKRVELKTQLVACADSCRVKLISQLYPMISSTPLSLSTTTHRANALTSRHHPRSSALNCCTSNVNPPPCLRRDDDNGDG